LKEKKILKIKRKVEIKRHDDRPIRKAITQLQRLQTKCEDVESKISAVEKQKVKTVEKIVEVPADVIIYRTRKHENVNYTK